MSMLKLYSIAFKNKIKIQRKDIEGGFAKPELKEVVIPKDFFNTETRQTLAHELGHCLHPLGFCAPREENYMHSAVGIVSQEVLRQEFAAWEWAIDHTEIDPAFLFRNLWTYANKVNGRVVKEVGHEFQTVWKMCEGFLPVNKPVRNPYTMYDTIIRQLDEMAEEQIPTVDCDDYRKKVNPTVEYGREKEKRVISKQMIDEIMRADPIPKVIEEQMKRYIDGLF